MRSGWEEVYRCDLLYRSDYVFAQIYRLEKVSADVFPVEATVAAVGGGVRVRIA